MRSGETPGGEQNANEKIQTIRFFSIKPGRQNAPGKRNGPRGLGHDLVRSQDVGDFRLRVALCVRVVKH